MVDQVRLGVVGACGRGGAFRDVVAALPLVRVTAVCDTNREGLPAARERLGADHAFLEYDEMLASGTVDAVLLGTPMALHVPQAMAALEAGIHVLSEVTAGVSVAECRALATACRRSPAVYAMSENYIYTRPNVLVGALVRAGLFGMPYYAEGEYLHELKALNEETRWRRTWQTGLAGVTYGTHSLGPLLDWMPGDRVVAVSCAGSGHHYCDAAGRPYENDDSTVMLGRLASGGLVKIRVDMLSERPHAMTNYQLQGTEGCYESARAPGERHRVWLRGRSGRPDRWQDLDEYADEFLPADWRAGQAAAEQAGHGGGDYYAMADFVAAIVAGSAPRVGIHQALDMTLPGLVSQAAIESGGWLAVPDSREW